MTIEELIAAGITPEYVYENRYKIDPFLEKYEIEVVAESEYPEGALDAVQETYYTVPYFIVISTSWGEFYKAECELGSYTDEWTEWYQVAQREKLITYYE